MLGATVAAGAVFAVTAVHLDATLVEFARVSVLGAALGALVCADLAEHRIPNRIVVPATLICAALLLVDGVHMELLGGLAVVTLILVLGLLGWTGTARLVRGETLSLRERDYVVAARSMGAGAGRIMFVHILPNLFSVIIISLMIDIGGLILVEAALSFLGLGVKPPEPTWGNMLQAAREYFTRGVHLVIMPGILIFVTVLCLYVIGDGLRDAFDPTSKE